MTSIIKKAISVKNAVLAENETHYFVVHYDTIILKVDKNTKDILVLLPVSLSSQNAIIEALHYLSINSSILESETLRLNGVTKSELMKIWKYKRYSQPARKNQSEMLQTVMELVGEE
jgi:hypothetical protein